MVRIPSSIADRLRRGVLQRMTCNQSENVYERIQAARRAEAAAHANSSSLVITAVLLIGGLSLLIAAAYAARTYYLQERSVYANAFILSDGVDYRSVNHVNVSSMISIASTASRLSTGGNGDVLPNIILSDGEQVSRVVNKVGAPNFG